jgi:hypothetical protein
VGAPEGAMLCHIEAKASRLPPLPQRQEQSALLWERRKARCSSHIEADSIAAAAAPTKAERGGPVGAPGGAMLLLHRSQKHRGCRRSHKSRSSQRPCGSAGRRDALRTSKPTASRLPPLPQKQSVASPVGAPEGAMLLPHRSQSIAAAAAPTKARAVQPPVGAPGGAMLFVHRSQKRRDFRRSRNGTAVAPVR